MTTMEIITIIGVIATVLGTIIGGISLWIYLRDRKQNK